MSDPQKRGELGEPRGKVPPDMRNYPLLRGVPDPRVGQEPRPENLYRHGGKPKKIEVPIRLDERFRADRSNENYDPYLYNWARTKDPLPVKDPKKILTIQGWRQGLRGGNPTILIHGVPVSSVQNLPLQQRMSPFADVFNLDMLGMGESDAPLNNIAYTWAMDAFYLLQVADYVFADNEKYSSSQGRFHLFADDWGGGIALTFATFFPNNLASLTLLNPIAFTGYEVAEIGAIGRAAPLLVVGKDDQTHIGDLIKRGSDLHIPGPPRTTARVLALRELWYAQKRGPEGDPTHKFAQVMATFDETVVQILKTMVVHPEVFNAYRLRSLMAPYKDTESFTGDGIGPSFTRSLKFDRIAVLALRSANLDPNILLPYDEKKNPFGLSVERLCERVGGRLPVLILWGIKDNMMPPAQRHKFANALVNFARVRTEYVPDAGHFAAVDQPDWVAEAWLDFIREHYGYGGEHGLTDIFQGWVPVLQDGTTESLQEEYRAYYGLAPDLLGDDVQGIYADWRAHHDRYFPPGTRGEIIKKAFLEDTHHNWLV